MKRYLLISLLVIFSVNSYAQDDDKAERYLASLLQSFPGVARENLAYRYLPGPISINKTARLIRGALKDKSGQGVLAFITEDTDALALAFKRALKRVPRDKPVAYDRVIISVSRDHFKSVIGHILNWKIPIQAMTVPEDEVFALRTLKAEYLLNNSGEVPRDQVTYVMQHFQKKRETRSSGVSPTGGSVSRRIEYSVNAYVTSVNGIAVEYGKNKTPVPAGINLVGIKCWNGEAYVELAEVQFFDPETEYQIGYAGGFGSCRVNFWKQVR